MNNIKICHGCGIQFTPNSRKQRYHSLPCWYASAEIRVINREMMLERWNDPEFQTLISEALREHWRNNPKYRAYISEVARERWHNNSEYRVRISETMREVTSERWRNDPEYRARISKAMRARWQQPEFRSLMIEFLKAAKRKQSAPAGSSNEKIPPKV